ncbi:ATPase P [Acidaminobacter sp. JC074]|uniref:ATPase P n=1 Tax=Acidaminobacter sp. JC074 TaxID=2530199 RepID=UPI001F0E4285|nr:ATPase P [Acidaminobacter sp. JC074]MCH4887160.1 ATPase P [Acidaminobacter sp. JC074]
MNIEITGLGTYEIDSIFIDYNGTIANNGQLMTGIKKNLRDLSENYQVYVITGDTFGTVRQAFEDTNIHVILANTAKEKADIISKHQPDHCLAIGNGAIDHLMFNKAGLSIGVIEREGASLKALLEADLVVTSIYHAFEIIESPKKIIATLKE